MKNKEKMYSEKDIRLAIEFGKRGQSFKDFNMYFKNENRDESKPYRIFNTICSYFKVHPEEVKERNRDKKLVYVRKIFSYFATVYFYIKQEDVAFIMRKERSVVVHYRNCIADWIDIQDEETIKDINNLKQLLNNG